MNTENVQETEEGRTQKKQFTLRINEADRVIISDRLKKEKKKINQDTWFYLGFVGEIGYAIALPIVGGALLGLYIERHMPTHPKTTLLLLFTGIIISILGFIRTIQILLNRKN